MSKSPRDAEQFVQKSQETISFARDLLEENERLRLEIATLKNEKANIEDENRRYAERFAEIERQHASLANLYVAAYRLTSTLDRESLLVAIQEIVVNLIGSEEHGVYELHGDTLHLIGHFGTIAREHERVPLTEPIIGAAVARSETVVPNGEGGVIACVPLLVDGAPVGAIAVFRLLEHKPALEPLDHELFELLATHAGTALYASRLHEAATREGLMPR